MVRDPGRWGNAELISRLASEWQPWESRLGGGDAQAIVATERRGLSGHTVGADNILVQSAPLPNERLEN